MTRVSFYVLGEAGASARLLLACRLTEKIYRQGQRVHLHCASEADCTHLDELLWTFRQGSFVPHASVGETDDPAPVTLGADNPPEAADCDVLVNLGAEVPLFFSRFERVAEIVDGSPEERANARRRYQFYRDRGYPLETHKIES